MKRNERELDSQPSSNPPGNQSSRDGGGGSDPLLVDRKEAARLLDVHKNSIVNMRKRGQLREIRILPGKPQYRMDEIQQLIDSQDAQGGPA